jgi:transcriptional regulator with XRE-family HTH domain
LTIKASHPKKVGYPKTLLTIGDHIRKRRLDLGLFQRQVAAQIGVDEASVWNWEKGGVMPEVHFMSRIITFLGYNPLPEPKGLPDRLIWARSSRGMSRVTCARMLGVDPSTLARWETGRWKPSTGHVDTIKKLFKTGS